MSKNNEFQPDLTAAKRPFYNLMMFPYPSAEGLHIGNMYAFTGADIYGRFMKLRGYDLFEPIGLDGFGIHSENYALKKNVHPQKMAKITEANFKRQLKEIDNAYAWDNFLTTYDPIYYKWTQWIFIQMFKKGLAYRKKTRVNWCDSCKTVLADEQVENGKCERCKNEVNEKELEQWFFKITKYAERLHQEIPKLNWSEKVKIAQKNWIGRSEGAEIKFSIINCQFSIIVFTTRPDTIFGVTYLVLAPEHELISKIKPQISNLKEVEAYSMNARKKSNLERIKEGKEKTGVELKGIKAINPATKKEIPIFIADYVLISYGTGAIMAVPAHDKRDFKFAKKYRLPIIEVVKSELSKLPYVGEGELTNSDKFCGMDSEKAQDSIIKFIGAKKSVQYKLRDWLISRQRYWGPPIPMINCPKCRWQTVSEKDLPVRLPNTEDWHPKGQGQSPLANILSFVNTTCPKCGGPAKRETDVSDTFLDSAWYFYRYLSPNDDMQIFDKKLADKWLPVNMYIGGAEHSVLHLLYVRFITYVFKELGLINFDSPFKKFRAHGLIIKDGAKMSKSRGNIINPDQYIKKYGSDALRMYLMFIGPFTEGGDFRDEGIIGIQRFLNKVKNFYLDSRRFDEFKIPAVTHKTEHELLNNTIKKVEKDIMGFNFNTAISQMMILLNSLQKGNIDGSERKSRGKELSATDREKFLIILSPFAPHLAEELWHTLGHKKSIFLEKWPESKEVVNENIIVAVQVNGKLRATLKVKSSILEKEITKLALKEPNVVKYLGNIKIKKIIYIPSKILSFVV